MYLNDDHQHRVAKNPMPCAPIHPLIFQELEAVRKLISNKSILYKCLMIAAIPATVNFPALAAGGPIWAFLFLT